MEQYKQEFIEFMVDSEVLKFGEFTLKSGRKSPFFMNAGAYVTGSQLKKLGEYYAKAIHDVYGDDFDVLFGPAYKGIPISVVTAIAYSELYGKEVRYCSDRKEEKDHGADKGSFLGSKLKDGDRVIMIEDVTTSGKSMEETVPKVKSVTHTPNALHHIRMLPQFPAQMADMHIYGSRFAEKLRSPDPVEDEPPAQYPASVPRKQQQELKFLAGKGDGFILDAHLISLLVDHQVPKHQGIVSRL